MGDVETLSLDFAQGEMLAVILVIYFPLILSHFQSLMFCFLFVYMSSWVLLIIPLLFNLESSSVVDNLEPNTRRWSM